MITPVIITQTRDRTPTPAERADIEAKERYDKESEREIFCAGARFQRGEDREDSDPNLFWQIPLFIAVLLLFMLNTGGFLVGLMEGCNGQKTYRYDAQTGREVGEGGCAPSGKWKYVIPGKTAGSMLGQWMK